ncbi:class III extradiol dioxygenase subunit B-like domain-containing protein [Kribbella sp. NPDC050820]|uniref:class III extradiol dioxygenase subunit B-like domain-containing protein n=1 Tax=Kribbella sp. NPDC050820 TaxID=3155408 RepID=UPI0033FBC12A
MSVVSAAVCPHPPLLVPEVASGAAGELDDLRAACLTAIEQLAAADRLLVLGSAPAGTTSVGPVSYDGSAGGSFGAYGAPGVRVGAGDAVLPLSLAMGAWLVEQTKAAGLPRSYLAVSSATSPAQCVQLGREIAAGNDRIGLLVMGDGSARRSEHSPVHLHPRAEIFDTTVATALGAADSVVLAALDPDLAAELQAAGRAPWQVLAGVLESGLTGNLAYHAAPYGVGYFVATFT